MKKRIQFSLLLTVCSFLCFSQIGVSYHDSALPFFGINYTLGNRVLSEARLETDLLNDSGLELVATYIFNKNSEVTNIYAGAGYNDDGPVFPIGINIYPLENKSFGFHIEVVPIIRDDGLIRGSWGIRYRFNQ